jgi:hypothetical protein
MGRRRTGATISEALEEVLVRGRSLTIAFSGAAEAGFAWLVGVFGGGPLTRGVRRLKRQVF